MCMREERKQRFEIQEEASKVPVCGWMWMRRVCDGGEGARGEELRRGISMGGSRGAPKAPASNGWMWRVMALGGRVGGRVHSSRCSCARAHAHGLLPSLHGRGLAQFAWPDCRWVLFGRFFQTGAGSKGGGDRPLVRSSFLTSPQTFHCPAPRLASRCLASVGKPSRS